MHDKSKEFINYRGINDLFLETTVICCSSISVKVNKNYTLLIWVRLNKAVQISDYQVQRK